MNTEQKLKDHALNQWLTSYECDNPEECYNALMNCQNDDEWDAALEKYQVTIWEQTEDFYWEFLRDQITGTYNTTKRLIEDITK